VAHDAPLKLVTGADAVLRWLPLVLAILALPAFLLPAGPWHIKAVFAAACLLAGATLSWRTRASGHGVLELRRRGAARWRTGRGAWQAGSWIPPAWLTGQYAVVCCSRRRRARRFIICRRQQPPEAFRILSSWIRLRSIEES
jgi:hypothetical protein